MEQWNILQIIITAVLAYIGYNGQLLINRIGRLERKIEDLIINKVSDKKDIEVLRRDVDDHKHRILKLEK